MKRLLFVIALFPLIFSFSFRGKDHIPGARCIYSWESKTMALSDIKQLYKIDTTEKTSFFQSKSLQLINLDVRCSIRKTVVEVNGNDQLVCFEIMNPVVSLKQNGQPTRSESIQQELTHPVFAEISPDGLIKIVRIDTAVSQVAGGVIKEMLSQMQFVSAGRKEATWRTREENTAGTYWAKYQVTDSNQSGYSYLKLNEGYILLRSAIPDQTITDNGRAAITVDSIGIVSDVDVLESRAVLVHNDTISLSKGRAVARLISASRATNSEVSTLMKLARTPGYEEGTELSARLSDEKINRLTYSRTLGDDTYKSLHLRLQQTGNDDVEMIDSLTSKFRALAYLFPGHCKDMARSLQSAEINSSAFKVLSDALNDAQIPAAVDALADVIAARSNEEEVLLELLPMLATSATPTIHAEAAVRSLLLSTTSPAVQSTAELALGAVAYHFKELDTIRSAEVTLFLLNRMKSETDTIQKILVLANTGDKAIIPVLKSYIDDDSVSVEVKQTAIMGLRLVEGREVDELLQHLLHHKNDLVVGAARQVIEFREQKFGFVK